MWLRQWWESRKEAAALTRRSLELNGDKALIAQHLLEFTGMSGVEGMAYTLEQARLWNLACTKAEAQTFVGRLAASNEAFKADGLTMPYWGNLWVLPTLQAEIGVAASKGSFGA